MIGGGPPELDGNPPSVRGAPGAFGLSLGSNTSERRPGPSRGATGGGSDGAACAASAAAMRAAVPRPPPRSVSSCARRSCCSSCWLRNCSCSTTPVSCRIWFSRRSSRTIRSVGDVWAISVGRSSWRPRPARSPPARSLPPKSEPNKPPASSLKDSQRLSCPKAGPWAANAAANSAAAALRRAYTASVIGSGGPDAAGSVYGLLRPNCDWRGFHPPCQQKAGAWGRRLAWPRGKAHELALSTVTARRFCDQQEMSLHTATGRSLP